MKNYSTTYTAEIVKLVSVFALIMGFDFNEETTTAVVGALILLATTGYTFYQRYKSGQEGRAGEVTPLGVRK